MFICEPSSQDARPQKPLSYKQKDDKHHLAFRGVGVWGGSASLETFSSSLLSSLQVNSLALFPAPPDKGQMPTMLLGYLTYNKNKHCLVNVVHREGTRNEQCVPDEDTKLGASLSMLTWACPSW